MIRQFLVSIHKSKKYSLILFASALFFLGMLIYRSLRWIEKFFGSDVQGDAILFTLFLSTSGVDKRIIYSFIRQVVVTGLFYSFLYIISLYFSCFLINFNKFNRKKFVLFLSKVLFNVLVIFSGVILIGSSIYFDYKYKIIYHIFLEKKIN